MLIKFSFFLFQRGLNQRSPGDYVYDDGFGVFGFWLLIGLIYLIYTLFFDEQRKMEKKARKEWKEIQSKSIEVSDNIKSFFIDDMSIKETPYVNKYQRITKKVSECIVKHNLDIPTSLVSCYIYSVPRNFNSSKGMKINQFILQKYEYYEYAYLEIFSLEYRQYLYKKNNKSLSVITKYLLKSTLCKSINGRTKHSTKLKNNLLYLKEFYNT